MINGGKNWSLLFAETIELHLGHKDHPVVSLTSHDWIEVQRPGIRGHNREVVSFEEGKEC